MIHKTYFVYDTNQVTTDYVRFGAATSLTSIMNKLKANQDQSGFHYFGAIVRHLKFVANVMVRNVSSYGVYRFKLLTMKKVKMLHEACYHIVLLQLGSNCVLHFLNTLL